MLIVGIFNPIIANAEEETVKITIVGTTDLHANIYNWSYEDGKESEDFGMTKVYSVIEDIRAKNPNTLLVDNGDTIQGTILSDDLYNFNLELKHPVIDVMNFMKYDAMTLGNHEFNFGLKMVDKIAEEAEFPLLAANATYVEDDSYLVEPYVIKEIAGVKVGILGITNPNIPRWDGPKVGDLKFATPVETAEKYIPEMKGKGADLIVVLAHMGYTSEYGGDGADAIVAAFPEVAAVLTGHSHSTEKQKVGNTLVGAARNEGRQVVKFDFELLEKDGVWTILESEVDIIEVKEYKASEELKEYAKEYHDKTLDFLVDVIGVANENFAPASEIPGIPEAQLRDTAVIDLINDVQLKATGADVAGAALFAAGSNLRAGNLTYASIFEIYKYPNTLIGVEVTGAELKAYMEWSAKYYNSFVPGDINLSFNPSIRVYNYDMFQGVDYKVDVSKPAGERIVDLKFKGELVKDTDILKLAINNYRYGGLKDMGIISGDAYFESDPKSLRSYIADHIAELETIDPLVDNNWEVIGANFNHPLRDYIIGEIKAGNIEIPVSEDGRTINVKAINAEQLIKDGKIPAEVLIAHEIVDKPTTEPVIKNYVVKSGDVLYRIAKMFNTTWEELSKFNNLKNPHLIFPGQSIHVPE
jgi:2',3'-cyclic-nucleotide 2'-phosphodiesterase/3'-nucleotidase